MSSELLTRLRPGMLCLADRGFYSFTAWQTASATGADLLCRVKDNLKLDVATDLPDGSWLADVFDSVTDRRRERPTRVRVIEYTIEDGRVLAARLGEDVGVTMGAEEALTTMAPSRVRGGAFVVGLTA